MLIHVSLKKSELILKVYVTFSRHKRHFKISLGETFLEHYSETLFCRMVSQHLRWVNFFATYRMCYLIPDYYPRILFHRYNEL